MDDSVKGNYGGSLFLKDNILHVVSAGTDLEQKGQKALIDPNTPDGKSNVELGNGQSGDMIPASVDNLIKPVIDKLFS